MYQLILPRLIQIVLNQGLEPLARLRVLWPALVGEPLGGLTAPQRLLDGQLYVQAQTQEAASQLQAQAQEILGRLEAQGVLPEYPGIGKVGLKVSVVGNLARRRGWVAHEETQAVERDSDEGLGVEVSERLIVALLGVEDEGLRSQLERMLFRDLERRAREDEGLLGSGAQMAAGGAVDPWRGRW